MKRHIFQKYLPGIVALGLATSIWFPCVHLLFQKGSDRFQSGESISPVARQLCARQVRLVSDPVSRGTELGKLRASNSEWDFMARSFLVWSLANLGLRDPAAIPTYLPVMDQIINETIKLEREKGIYVFLMPYARERQYEVQPARSLFVDGEIALMLGVRRMLEEKSDYKAMMTERVNVMVERLQRNALRIAESYPNECWMFDHVVALDAVKLADRLDGTDHSKLFRDWLATARTRLIHRESGLLISSFTLNGEPLDGPEGSSIWMVAHCLRLLDDDFAHDQYRRARSELGRTLRGFGYAHEWPKSWNGPMDIDSGPVVPVLGISAGSSGMAFIGAAAFNDDNFVSALATTLDFAAFPSRKDGALKYCASNQVGDAALLYAAVLGPAWDRIKTGWKP